MVVMMTTVMMMIDWSGQEGWRGLHVTNLGGLW